MAGKLPKSKRIKRSHFRYPEDYVNALRERRTRGAMKAAARYESRKMGLPQLREMT